MTRATILPLAAIFCLAMTVGTAQDMGGTPATEAKAGGLSGTIKWDGDVPKARKLNSQLEADKYCGAQHTDAVFAEDLVVDKESKAMANVFVYVKKGLKTNPGAPKDRARLGQKGCVYSPHVVGVVVGQELEVVNDDDTMHNVHSLPEVNKEFNKGQGRKGAVDVVTFSMPELNIKVKCDVHPWMGARIHVVDNPFFAVSAKDGKYTIPGLEDGEYEIEAVHEKHGKQAATVKVSGGACTQDFTFKKVD